MAEILGAGALGRAGDAHGSHATPVAHGAPGLSGAAFTTPPRPAVVQRASRHLHGSPLGHSSAPPHPTHLSMMSGGTMGPPRGSVFHQPPAWLRTTSSAGVLEYRRPTQLVQTDYLVDHGFTWVNAVESDAASRTTAYLQASGYSTTFHPAASPSAFAAVRQDVQENDIGGRPRPPTSSAWSMASSSQASSRPHQP